MSVRTTVAAGVAMVLLVAAAGCGTGSSETEGGDPKKVTIAVGSGIAYAPLTIMKAEKMLEKKFPDTEFVWNEGVSGGAATRDGMIADKVQVGVAGIAPFLVGVDKGVEWKVLGSMGQLSIDLVSIDPKVDSLEALDQSGKAISLPSPDSGQAIALKALGERELGDVKAFDDQLAPMGHPDAYQGLLNGTTKAAFIGPPFQYQLIDDHDATKLAGAWDVFGPMTYSAVVLTEDFYDQYPEFAASVYDALNTSLDMLDKEPAEAAKILSDDEGGKTSPKQYEEWIQRPETEWSATPKGYMNNAKFMKSVGLISEVPKSIESLMFKTVSEGAK